MVLVKNEQGLDSSVNGPEKWAGSCLVRHRFIQLQQNTGWGSHPNLGFCLFYHSCQLHCIFYAFGIIILKFQFLKEFYFWKLFLYCIIQYFGSGTRQKRRLRLLTLKFFISALKNVIIYKKPFWITFVFINWTDFMFTYYKSKTFFSAFLKDPAGAGAALKNRLRLRLKIGGSGSATRTLYISFIL